MSDPSDDDFRRLMLEFRSSATAEFDAIDKRFTGLEERMGGLEGRMGGLEGRMAGLETSMRELTDEYRTRTMTMEKAILNSLRDVSRSFDARLIRAEDRLDDLERPDSAS